MSDDKNQPKKSVFREGAKKFSVTNPSEPQSEQPPAFTSETGQTVKPTTDQSPNQPSESGGSSSSSDDKG